MANIALVIAVLICFAGVTQTEAWPWPWWRHLPHPPMQPGSPPQPPNNSAPPSPSQASIAKIQKCLSDMNLERRCIGEIMGSFWSRYVTIEPDCCKALAETHEDCSNTVFASLQSPLQSPMLKSALNDQCNKKSPTPSKA